MPRYIDADALIADLDKALLLARTNEEIADLKLCKEIVRSAPTISPDEVRGVGEWIADSVASNVFRCSICGSDAPVCPTGGNEYKSRYCPNCGAKMEVSEDA